MKFHVSYNITPHTVDGPVKSFRMETICDSLTEASCLITEIKKKQNAGEGAPYVLERLICMAERSIDGAPSVDPKTGRDYGAISDDIEVRPLCEVKSHDAQECAVVINDLTTDYLIAPIVVPFSSEPDAYEFAEKARKIIGRVPGLLDESVFVEVTYSFCNPDDADHGMNILRSSFCDNGESD